MAHKSILNAKQYHAADTRSQSGFTLIEITFAILILAGSLIILLGLQSSIIQRTVRDQDKLQAMLIARRIMAGIETTALPVDNQDQEEPVSDLIDYIEEGQEQSQLSRENLQRFYARLTVNDWGLPRVEEQVLQRVELTVSWSDLPEDSVHLVYFIPADEADSLLLDENDEDQGDF